ncbi:hypothetical protein PV326_008094 [Microctonus aethiopoides]|nr:hypothetical protein PV326_008094 [Microctonus aethiopoides]
MTHGKEFIISIEERASRQTYQIKEGLQQGTVNSPILFSIFTSDILNSFDLNRDNGTASIAFADDTIIYIKEPKIEKMKLELETLINKINNYYAMWNLRINPIINKAKMLDAANQGYPQPQTFILLDNRGIIQDEANIPIIYHWKRHKKNKKIPTSWETMNTRPNALKYSTTLPKVDREDSHRLNPQYWWLRDKNAIHIEQLKQRLRARLRQEH